MKISLEVQNALLHQPIDLPVFNPIALTLLQLLADPYTDTDDIVRTINEDQALSAQVLKMANSPVYVGRIKSETIKESAIRLGARQITNIAMAASQASLHTSDNPLINGLMQELWLHSHACALGCWWVALNTGHQNLADHAYMAGLLHDIGKLSLLKALERLAHQTEIEFLLEREPLIGLFSEMHVQQGCRIMDHWNMPLIYRDIVANHHSWKYDPEDYLLAILRLVNVTCRKMNLSLNPEVDQENEMLFDASLLGVDHTVSLNLEQTLTDSKKISLSN